VDPGAAPAGVPAPVSAKLLKNLIFPILARLVLRVLHPGGSVDPLAPGANSMQTAATQPSLFMRDHTILGVCEGLGEDFGFNPIYLRVAFAVPLIINPLATLGVYAALGVVVMLSRLLVREPRPAFAKAPAGEPAMVAEHAAPTADNEDEAQMVAVAA
jgi:phage shock protein PspC (stress-responsive transcriptional regulator)